MLLSSPACSISTSNVSKKPLPAGKDHTMVCPWERPSTVRTSTVALLGNCIFSHLFLLHSGVLALLLYLGCPGYINSMTTSSEIYRSKVYKLIQNQISSGLVQVSGSEGQVYSSEAGIQQVQDTQVWVLGFRSKHRLPKTSSKAAGIRVELARGLASKVTSTPSLSQCVPFIYTCC